MKYRALAASLLLIAAGSTTQAASLALVPSASTVAQNGVFTVALVLNAADVPGPHPNLHGGQIVVDFDLTKLSHGGFSLAGSPLSYFPVAGGPVVATNGNIRTVTFGFENAADIGTVGTFTFTALGAPGSIAMIGLKDADDVFGSFASYYGGNQPFYPNFVGAQVTVVPAPASLWLLGTAVGALAIRRRLRHAAA